MLGIALTTIRTYAQSSICYAAPGGNDANDGSYWAFAKADVMACYEALPAAGGTIFVRDDGGNGKDVPACGPSDPPGCGIWIMGHGDPNFAHPPVGWRRAKSAVNFVGIGGSASSFFGLGQQVRVTGGGNSARLPNVWLSGVLSHTFTNIAFTGGGYKPLLLGVDSTGNTNYGTAWNYIFENDAFYVANAVGAGPAVTIGAADVWDFFNHCNFSGGGRENAALASCLRHSGAVTCTSTVNLPSSWKGTMNIGVVGVSDASFDGLFKATITGPNTITFSQSGMDDASSRGGQASSDAGQVFVMNPGPGFGNGLIFIQNSFLYGGGIRAYANAGGGEGIYVANILQEAGYAPPVEMVGCPHTSTVSNIQIADALTSFAGFRVDNASSCASGNLAMAQETSVDGPAILMGAASPPSSSVLPETMGQYGIVNGKVYAQADTPRRGFGPIAARFPNLARQVASTWNTGGCPTAIAGVAVAAPDGTTNAGAVSHGADATACFYGGTQKLNAGDTFLMGVWARSASGNGFARGTVFQLACDHCTFNGAGGYVQPGPNLGGAGEWDWVWLAARVTASNGSDIMHFQGTVNSSHKADFFAPVLIRIPAGTLTANEIGEMALHLQSYRDDAEVGQVSLLRGEQFKADSIQVGDGPTITSGAGPPKSPASPGCIYLRRDGAPGSTFYIYEKGGWKAQF